MDHLVFILGLMMVGIATLQFGLWTSRGLRLRHRENKRFDLELKKLRAEIFQITQQRPEEPTPNVVTTDDDSATEVTRKPSGGEVNEKGHWTGFRSFVIAKLVRETKLCTSVYLAPTDGKRITDYAPGQHITIRLKLPSRDKPVVRCYTISDCPNGEYYRISVKICLPPPRTEHPDGQVSTWINRQMTEGQKVELKAPSGAFYLQPGTEPAVFLAGGIGITPMLSMINSVAASKSGRECLLFYGVRDGEDHTFKRHFQQLAAKHENIHVANFYSNPLSTDRLNEDYHIQGFVSIDILKQVLPTPNFDFYLCGPPPFMNALHAGLLEWGVDESRIRYEAFGPASIGKPKKNTQTDAGKAAAIPVTFSQSKKAANWDGTHDNLLDLIEDNAIPIDSGCRAGSCGTCQTRLLKGAVAYEDPEMVDCEPEHCLPCIAQPTEAIELDV